MRLANSVASAAAQRSLSESSTLLVMDSMALLVLVSASAIAMSSFPSRTSCSLFSTVNTGLLCTSEDLFDSYALCKIPGVIRIIAFADRDVVGEQLERDRVCYWCDQGG